MVEMFIQCLARIKRGALQRAEKAFRGIKRSEKEKKLETRGHLNVLYAPKFLIH